MYVTQRAARNKGIFRAWSLVPIESSEVTQTKSLALTLRVEISWDNLHALYPILISLWEKSFP